MEYETRAKKEPTVTVFGYDATKTPAEERKEVEATVEVLDTVGVKHKDLVISVSGEPNGVLYGRTKSEALKYCADILLVAAGEDALVDNIEIVLALQETLQFDYNWKPIKIFEFIRKWKRNLYLKQIGEENTDPEAIAEMEKALAINNKDKKVAAIKEGEVEDKDRPEELTKEEKKELAKKPKKTKISVVEESIVEG